MTMRYYYHEHLTDYATMKSQGLKSRGQIYGTDDPYDFSSRPFLEDTLSRIDSPAGGNVLEIGCGSGPGACLLAKRGFRVHGIDLIPDAIEQARINAADLGLDITYAVMDVCDLPRNGPSFDMIVDSYCTQGIVVDEDRERMFTALKERLALDGWLVMTCVLLVPYRVDPNLVIVDESSGRTFVGFDGEDLWDAETETCYNLFEVDPARPEDGPSRYDGTIQVNGKWYIHCRRYRTAETLKAELEHHGFRVLHQSGEFSENTIAVRQDGPITSL